jgi:hypothetical protein
MPASQFGVVAVLSRGFRLVFWWWFDIGCDVIQVFGVELHDASGNYAGPRKLYNKAASRIANVHQEPHILI